MRLMPPDAVRAPQIFLTRAEVADLMRISVERVRQWDRRGLLPRVRVPGTKLVLYPQSEIFALLERATGYRGQSVASS